MRAPTTAAHAPAQECRHPRYACSMFTDRPTAQSYAFGYRGAPARASRPYHLPPALPLRAVSEPEDKYSFSPASAYSAPIFAAEAPGLSTSIVPGASTVARSTALDRSAPVAAPQLHAPEAAAQGTPQPHMLDSSRFPISVAPAPPASLREPAAVDGSAGGQVSRTVDVLQPTLGSVGAEPRVSSYDADGPPPMYRP